MCGISNVSEGGALYYYEHGDIPALELVPYVSLYEHSMALEHVSSSFINGITPVIRLREGYHLKNVCTSRHKTCASHGLPGMDVHTPITAHMAANDEGQDAEVPPGIYLLRNF